MTQNAAHEQRQGRRYSGLDASERTRQRREALLEAALELFASQGYPATSVKQLCRQAGLTERYFYESFRDRHACLMALYDELIDRLRAATVAALDDEIEADAVTWRGLSAFVEHLTADTRRARVILLEVVGISAELEDRRHAVLRDFAEITTAVWLRFDDQSAPSDRQRLAALGLVGAVNHLLVDWLHRGRQEQPTVLVETCSTLFEGARKQLES
ncbi:TetR/AcrR family transcriptional regulator [Saccharopolyspora endophytica]|uniref:TetR/AcrR family transcriptional regulator n=1 Tax=Saccharopolyspora endophytica TaxID=543886 RepID=A0ABS5DPP4_9PSEU|nr:TetR/AcrR family transcriptional regulator [Saccharopolyspora endophytica]MBQ0928272.1 TetR/AcrR family transcriptional regulator [Saccharopolyspora endophytica]